MRLEAVSARQVLVDGAFRPATVVLRDGRIASIDPFRDVSGDGVLRVPDAAVVVPGVVDTHVHVNEPGRTEWEGFRSATEAAALGGVTTLVDMPLNAIPPTTTVAHLELKQQAAQHQLLVDVGFWGGAVPGNVGDLEPLWDAGVFGFKCFLSPSGVDEFPPLDRAELLAALREIARFDGLMIVHAEDAAILESTPAPATRSYREFAASRPDAAEAAAIRQVVDGARETGARVHVLHLSSARALDVIAEARAEGLRLTVETCPHYLCFTADAIPDAAPEFTCCPPIRDAGNREALWQALDEGLIDCVVSDHSPSSPAEKYRGDGDLMQAWGGISGLQVGFAAMAHEARRRGIGPDRVSAWMSRNTADLVGLGRKGRIEVGADADLAVYDPTTPYLVEAASLAHRHPISAYDGLRLDGRVTTTVVRGEIVDAAAPDPTHGRPLTRPDLGEHP
ncbi:allantoinase [Aeromicrobium flavum]|uniref:allantoinase n=1 Tax=Aeromicrobium flavum TaxID=416568 RepID=A0A512HVB7_9ACTN|nr:allantoinase AllB [Aeromicrobium flavum]GEO89397.1 allantoinase [Aeromicrobium flavum]